MPSAIWIGISLKHVQLAAERVRTCRELMLDTADGDHKSRHFLVDVIVGSSREMRLRSSSCAVISFPANSRI